MDDPDRVAIAAQVERVFNHDLRANMAFHQNASPQVVNVSCSELRHAPFDVLRDIREVLGMGWAGADSETVRQFLRRQSRRGPGRHHYSQDGWGITPEEVGELFGDYRSTFAERLAG
jgi:hypothetical protein